MKKILILLSAVALSSCAELQSVVNNLPTTQGQNSSATGATQKLSSLDISNGLKQALEIGVSQGVQLLSKQNGYYGNSLVKIPFPTEIQKVENTLRQLGLGSLADQGVKLLNTAAEQAVVKAQPIFVQAIKNMTFTDAASILAGDSKAATQYLQKNTEKQLVSAFSPDIKNSLDKVGANKIWSEIISKYNQIPLVAKVQPDLTQYVTEKSIEGLFKQIAVKEADIRQNLSARTTPLLKKVFSN